ncbi:hypothetical protein LXT21_31785 [Myxococcus sp. K38C18041901]|uniref:hypothetical protein n=1 Tax=Myxococcus guangdongensis TaxID=2906760 RepID=UPI0020A7261F|nr:hypothetical protein [Myxococcus guangdongensis]MCP3063371.1 hypothetical protein [Myxococcus guangdongensis]
MVLWAWFAPGLALAEDVSPFRHRMQRAAAQYEALEYEKALNGLTQAKQVASTTDEQVEVALYRGLVLSDLGRRKQALEEFRVGLSLKPDAVLPTATGPKVERDFESVRKQVRQQQGTASETATAKAPAAKAEEPEAPRSAEVPQVVAVQETPVPAPVAPEPEPEAPPKKDLRSKLGAAGSTLGKNVGNALGSALDSVMGSKKKPEEPAPAASDTAKKDEP